MRNFTKRKYSFALLKNHYCTGRLFSLIYKQFKDALSPYDPVFQ